MDSRGCSGNQIRIWYGRGGGLDTITSSELKGVERGGEEICVDEILKPGEDTKGEVDGFFLGFGRG